MVEELGIPDELRYRPHLEIQAQKADTKLSEVFCGILGKTAAECMSEAPGA